MEWLSFWSTIMSWFQTLDCDGKCLDHILRRQLLCDIPGKIQAARNDESLDNFANDLETSLTVDANILPPNQTAYRCIWCVITWTSIGFGCGVSKVIILLWVCVNFKGLTLIRPSLKFSLILSLVSTDRLISRWSLRPKSLNMVEPPLSTILLYKGRLTSIGQFWITLSTISDNGMVKSGFENSGWKKISGPGNDFLLLGNLLSSIYQQLT